MNKKRIFKNIDSILQVTKETVNKNDNYYNYIVNQNNNLYKKQLPLLMKNSRINALVLSKTKIDFNKKPSFSMEKIEKKNFSKTNKSKVISPLSTIRNTQMRSKKLPPLCPLYNSKGELVPSIIKSSKILLNKSIYFNDNNIVNCTLGYKQMGSTQNIFRNKKLKIKKLKYNNSCDFDIKLDYDEKENKQFNEPEYDNLKYDESKIFGQKKLYEEMIKTKIIELQNVYNKNLTIKKEKIYKYGLEKIKMIMNLDSLKIKINEIKDQKSIIIEKNPIPTFEYTLPFALLPLFYFRGVKAFLIILTKLIIFNEVNQTFEVEKNDDKIISNILKNCVDFNIDDDNNNNYPEEKNQNNIKFNSNYNNNLIDNKNSSLNNSFINSQTNSSVNINSVRKQNSLENNEKQPIIENNNTVNPNNRVDRVGFRESIPNIKKKGKIKKFDVYPKKHNNDDISTSIYEFFWITKNKSYILTIETPLITITVPSHSSVAKKYINYELLFYLYSMQFIMWDFYIIKYLSTYKNFRNFLEQIYSLPEKRNILLYIANPKIKKNLFTFYELTSILTRETVKTVQKIENNLSAKSVNTPYNNINDNNKISPKKRNYNSNKKELKKDNSIDSNNNSTNRNEEDFENSGINLVYQFNETNGKKNLNSLNFNSLFIQKGLLIVASYINTKKNITNEYTFHFNIDQLRKFQKMEVLVDKLSFFIKFLKISYENESISFDFESFNEFDETLWIKDMKKYNFKYLKNYQVIYEEKKIDENAPDDDVSIMKIYKGINKYIKIKIEIKYPLIIMKGLDEYGFRSTEKINVEHKIENILRNLTINNSLDLTKQIINILKENNFCRKEIVIKRNVRKKTIKQKKTIDKDNLDSNEN